MSQSDNSLYVRLGRYPVWICCIGFPHPPLTRSPFPQGKADGYRSISVFHAPKAEYKSNALLPCSRTVAFITLQPLLLGALISSAGEQASCGLPHTLESRTGRKHPPAFFAGYLNARYGRAGRSSKENGYDTPYL